MYNQHPARFLQLNQAFIGINNLLQENGFLAQNGKRLVAVKIRVNLDQFFEAPVTVDLGTYKNTPCKIPPPGYKINVLGERRLQLDNRLCNLFYMLMGKGFI